VSMTGFDSYLLFCKDTKNYPTDTL
jgi:hypothetical protein